MKLLGPASNLVRIGSLLVATALLAACNSEPAPEVVSKAAKPKPAATAKPAAAAADPTSKMARAVGNGKPGAAVDMKYDILARPAVGTPVEVAVVLIPGPGVDSMEATFTGMDGITLAGTLTASFPEVKAGEPYKHTLSLLPDRNGVFYITVSVITQMAGDSLGRTFSLPFVVGSTSVQEKPTAPAVDSTGEAIESMPAEEK